MKKSRRKEISPFMKKYSALLSVFLLITLTSITSFAAEETHVNISGFGSVGLTTSDSEDLGFRRSLVQSSSASKKEPNFLTDFNLGFQLSATKSKIRGIIQLLARDHIDNSANKAVHYAFLGANLTNNIEIKIGRNPLDFFLLASYRHVGYAHPWVRPPSEFYSSLFADNYEGVELSFNLPMSRNTLLFTAYGGIVDAALPVKDLDVLDFKYKPVIGGKVDFTQEDIRLSAGYLHGTIKDSPSFLHDMGQRWQGIPQAIAISRATTLEDSEVNYYYFGGSWKKGKWTLQGEAGLLKYPDVLNFTYTTAYASLSYRWEKWTPYVVLATFKSELDNLPLPDQLLASLPPAQQALAYQALTLAENISGEQSSFSLGSRYELTSNSALKFQWTYDDVEKGKVLVWERLSDKPDAGGGINVWSVTLDFIF